MRTPTERPADWIVHAHRLVELATGRRPPVYDLFIQAKGRVGPREAPSSLTRLGAAVTGISVPAVYVDGGLTPDLAVHVLAHELCHVLFPDLSEADIRRLFDLNPSLSNHVAALAPRGRV